MALQPYAYDDRRVDANGGAPDERMYKRRRLDGPEHHSSPPVGHPPGPGAPPPHWSAPAPYPPPPHTYAPRHDGPYRGPPAYGAPDAPPPAHDNREYSRWSAAPPPPSSGPAYPEVPYQQQPYYYGQQHQEPPRAPTVAYAGGGEWSSEQRQSYASPSHAAAPPPPGAVSSPYAREHSHASAPPYYPPASKPPGVEGDSATPAAPAYQYGESQTTSQYTYPSNEPSRGQRDVARPAPYYYQSEDVNMNMKIQSLPILDNLATQLIHTLSSASYPQIKELMSGSDAEESQAYATLKSLFDQTRKVYSRDTPFIDAIAIQMFQPAQQEIIRKANIATFISSILGAFDVTFYHLNEYFMETFVPLGHRLLKWQGGIYLEMKTQTYISSLLNSQGSPEALLDELFPPDLDAQILTRHPDAPSLSPSEQDFIDRSRKRKKYLLAEPASTEAARELQKKYSWQDFSREFASCISKNVDSIMNVPSRAQTHGGKNASHDAAAGASLPFGKGGIPHGVAAAAGAGLPGVTAPAAKPSDGDAGKKPSAAAGTSSTVRQPWTKPEEDALLAGLEKVNGPHWSQILALYGRGGSISEVLKDRNQVQLKDKARNLKLWHLKTGKEVPPSLRGVTGELRKRGGARARAALGLLDEENGGAGEGGKDEDGPAKKKVKK